MQKIPRKVILNGTEILNLDSTSAAISDVADGKAYYNINGYLVEGTDENQPTELEALTVTDNGVFTPETEGLDIAGWNYVRVDVEKGTKLPEDYASKEYVQEEIRDINAIVLDNKLYLTKDGEIFTEGTKLPTGGGGSSSSVITLQNLLPSMVVTAAKGNAAILKFSYSSAEYSGDGAAYVYVNQELKEVRTISPGENIIPISNLSVGTSSVEIKCMDIYSNSKSITYTVKIVDMYIQSSFSDTNLFKNNILYVYKAFGSVDKKVHFLLDGEDIPGTPVDALESTSGDESSQEIGILTHGVHTLQVYSDAYIENDYISSDKLNYDLVYVVGGDKTPLLASSYNVTSCKEGEYVNIPYFIYDPNTTECEVTLTITKVGEEVPYLIETRKVAQQKQFWRTNKFPIGTVTFTITYVPVSTEFEPLIKEYRIEVSQGDIPGAIGSPILYLSSEGRSNQQSNRELWTYQQSNGNIIDTTFSNMNWKTTGWVDDTKDPKVPGETALRLNGKASAEINFKPFETTAVTSGLTLELEFAIRDVNNRDATVIECKYGKVGFVIKANQAEISNGTDTLSCYFKDEEKVRISFVICNNKEGDGNSLMYIYLNGVMSSVKQYTSNFSQATPSTIKIGSSDCGIDIYTIRCYQMGLDRSSIVKNYIADTRKLEAKIDLNSDNNIYENKKVSYSLVTERIPTMTITGRLPVGEDDKFDVKISYRDCFEPSLNFDESCSIQVQGTSSLAYPVKNYKLKFSKTIQHAKNQLPAKVFCLKADYAEATGTHNTQNANFVETLYDNDHKTPAQQNEPKCRTTIYGFPCVIFHKATSDSEPVFIGKYNFNYDKGSENVFGFEKKYDVECWEFGTNIDDACMFRKEIPENFYGIFEPRCYYANVDNETVQALGYSSLEDLHDKIGDELDDLGKAYTETPDILSDAEKQHFKDISNASIARFKQMHDWVRSTDTKNATNSVFAEQKIINGEVFKADTDKYRLAKFKAEFEEYFDKYYCLIYYVYTFVALMVDQRAKNMFLTYWGDTQKWQPWFYDNDTCFGIDNEGELKFDYYHEDYSGDDELDKYGAEYVYAGRNSVLWYNFSQAFATDIKKMYTDLRSNNKITYDTLIDYFITNGSDRWSENLYNEDGEVKYIRQLKDYNNGEHLKRLRGTGEEHLRYFLENRIKYCDSKWNAGDYETNNVHLRINKPAVWQGVEPRLAITITPYSNFYAGVVYSQGTGLRVTYVKKNVATELAECDSTEVTNIETDIYGASEISDLGDLAPLYCGTVDVSKATKLKSLKIGSNATGYKNESLQQVSLGANVLLQDIDIRNCVNMNDTLRLAQCPNIKNIYAGGSAITQVELPEAGYLETLELPATITKLKLTNQSISNGFSMEGSGELTDLWIENCPNINSLNIIKNAPKLDYITLTNIDWTLENDSLLQKIYSKKGYAPENKDEPMDHGYLTGQCHVSIITQASLDKYKQAWPSLKITYDTIGVDLIFMSEDGTTELYRQTVVSGSDGTDPVNSGIITPPQKTPTEQYAYAFAGWSREQGASQPNSSALEDITYDTYVYMVYKTNIRTYTIEFYNGTTLLQSTKVPYGSMPSYNGATPTNPAMGVFEGWEPMLQSVTGPAKYYAKFGTQIVSIGDISYTIDDNLDLTITKYLNTSAQAIEIPSAYTINGVTYPVKYIGVNAFYSKNKIQSIKLPEGIVDIGEGAFYGCQGLNVINIPNTVSSIGEKAFNQCKSLVTISIPDSVTSIGREAFYQCNKLQTVALGNGLTEIQVSLFAYCETLKTITIPEGVTKLCSYAFQYCYSLNSISLPSSLETIELAVFEQTSLTNIYIPKNVKTLASGTFRNIQKLLQIDVDPENEYYTVFEGFLYNKKKTDLLLWPLGKEDTIINIPSGTIKILSSAFSKNKVINQVIIPEGVTTLDSNAFEGCSSLQSISIPKTVVGISSYVFSNCTSLSKVYINDVESWCKIDFYLPSSNPLYYGGNLYLNNELLTELEIPKTIIQINRYAFMNCKSITKVTMLNVQVIADRAFSGCSSLTEVIFADALISIGAETFYNCTSLVEIVFPENLRSLSSSCFGQCISLTSIIFKGAPNDIQSTAFSGTLSTLTINVPWSIGQVANAPWGAEEATIVYDYTPQE